MSRITRKLRRYSMLIVALVAALPVSMGITQERSSDLADSREAQCPAGRQLDPYEVWATVETTEGAVQFIEERFHAIGNVYEFVVWLRCQDFSVYVFEGKDIIGLRDDLTKIAAIFSTKSYSRNLLWSMGTFYGGGKPYVQGVDIYLNEEGRIHSLSPTYAVN